MRHTSETRFLMIGSFADSLLQFRGELISDLMASGQDVHIAAPGLRRAGRLREQLEAKGATLHDIPLQRTGSNPLADFVLLVGLIRLMRRIRPHRVLSYTVKPVIYGTLAAWISRVPRRVALVTGLGYVFQGQRKKGFLRRLVQQLYAVALRHAEMVFFQNPDDEILFRQLKLLRAGVPSCVVNGSGVDITAFAPVPLPRQSSFLLIARLIGDKGVREYAEAARRIRSRHPEVIFELVGWIDENPDAIGQHELDAWIAEGTLNFLGRMRDVRPAFARCSVYVLPSYYPEGTPRTVLEAMAMGRAVITTDAPGCRETVVDGQSGILVPVRSVDALELAMQRLIDEPTLVAQMGARSRRIAVEKYDVRKVNSVMLRAMGIA